MQTSFRALMRRLHRRTIDLLARELDDTEMAKPAIVFAPHPDDETLGCGGTIIKKRRMGVDVKIVFMTDGSRSHDLVPASELRSARAREALAASRLLGLAPDDVILLGFPDGELGRNLDAAVARVTEILQRWQAEALFIPYYRDKDPSRDHPATNRIVVSALRASRGSATIYEYPIWFWWRRWPWTAELRHRRRRVLRVLKRHVASGLTCLREFRRTVYVGDVLDRKRGALDQHRSQMTELVPDSRWSTLPELSGGEFLECFFQEREVFRSYVLPGRAQRRKASTLCLQCAFAVTRVRHQSTNPQTSERDE